MALLFFYSQIFQQEHYATSPVTNHLPVCQAVESEGNKKDRRV